MIAVCTVLCLPPLRPLLLLLLLMLLLLCFHCYYFEYRRSTQVGPYDTWVLEAPSLTGPFKLVSYMPRFGQQAYFVSFPSKFLGGGGSYGGSSGGGEYLGPKDAVMAFSANFACKTAACQHIPGSYRNVTNIAGAEYGATLLPVRFG